jgi:exodeoxyribonuclease V gamma subunit
LEQLVAFFRHPAKVLLRLRLGLQLASADDELADDEPFLPDGLGRLALAERLLPPLLAGATPAQVQALAEAGQELPAGALGAQALSDEVRGLTRFAEAVRAATAAPCLPPASVTLAIDVDGTGWQLSAGFADLRADGLLRTSPRTRRPGDHLAAWLHHLLLCAAAPPGVAPVTTWLMRDGLIRFRPCADPRAELTPLLRLLGQGLCAPLPFFPKTSWAAVEDGDDLAAAARCWTPSAHAPFAEGGDAANRLVWRGRPDPVLADDGALLHTAHAVLDPLFAHLDGGAR